ncbi:response regulator [Methanoplanus sp. FWC-SCC4]|uniref:Response regulator n=1 Tax=Methanochimaera problematica TaxID=2609417 RepID=A0AA97FCA5_9EURY|nr:response regulator [Methanoplanus sp. FWC-SCC4]WOF16790.1 response regulator [Methanoplanus sp. FWC-SCC4]
MEYSDKQISILYVDDEALLLDLTKRYLEKTGDFSVETESSAKNGLKKIKEKKYDAVISDYKMADMDGLELLRTIRDEGNNIPFIIFTGRGREEVAVEALNEGADYYLQKGGKPKVQFGELQNLVRQAVAKKKAESELLEHQQRLEEIINFLPDATFAIDKEGKVIVWNRAIEEMTGIPVSEMLGKGEYEYSVYFYGRRRPMLINLILDNDLKNQYSYPNINSKNGDKLYTDILLPNFRNNEVYMWFIASPLYSQEGDITGAIESIRDITHIKLMEKALGDN